MKKGYRVLLVFAMALLLTVVCRTGVQAASDVTLKNGKWVSGTFTSEETDQYYKINVKKTGYIRVQYNCKTGEYAQFDLCNAQKKEIVKNAGALFKNKADSYIGVKKGTYYIHISRVEGNYKIRYTFTAMNKIAKTVKPGQVSKAQTLKKNKQVSGVILPENKQRRVYYRFDVPEKKTVKFQYEIGSNQTGLGLWLRIADAKGKFMSFKDNGTVDKSQDLNTAWDDKGNDSVVLEAGTYYFVIQAAPGNSGYFKLKLK